MKNSWCTSTHLLFGLDLSLRPLVVAVYLRLYVVSLHLYITTVWYDLDIPVPTSSLALTSACVLLLLLSICAFMSSLSIYTLPQCDMTLTYQYPPPLWPWPLPVSACCCCLSVPSCRLSLHLYITTVCYDLDIPVPTSSLALTSACVLLLLLSICAFMSSLSTPIHYHSVIWPWHTSTHLLFGLDLSLCPLVVAVYLCLHVVSLYTYTLPPVWYDLDIPVPTSSLALTSACVLLLLLSICAFMSSLSEDTSSFITSNCWRRLSSSSFVLLWAFLSCSKADSELLTCFCSSVICADNS